MLLFAASARFPAEVALFVRVHALLLFEAFGEGEDLLRESELLVYFCFREAEVGYVEETYGRDGVFELGGQVLLSAGLGEQGEVDCY